MTISKTAAKSAHQDTPGLRLSALLAASLDAVITVDVEGRIIEFNPAAETMFRMSAKEARSRSMADTIIPEKYRARHSEGMKRYIDSGKSSILDKRLELEGLRADGELFDIELTVHATTTEAGDRTFIAFIRDISDRKRALQDQQRLTDVERESQFSRAKFQALFDQSLYFAAVLTLDGTVTDVNQTALVRCGYQFDDIVGLPYWETAWWRGSTKVQETIRNAIENAADGRVFQARLPYWVADGSERVTDFSLMPVHNDGGDVIFIVPTGLDITDQHRSELREEREAQMKRFLDDATVAVYASLDYEKTLETVTHLCVPTLADWAFLDLLDQDGTVKRVAVAHTDPQQAKLAARVAKFAAHRNALNHPPAQGLFGGKSLLIEEFTEEMLVKAAQSPEHEDVMRAVAPKSFVVVPLIARGVPLGALTLLMSHSGRRHDGATLKVAEEVARRAAIAVDNARLYRLGQQANTAKTEFIANVSHEIRTPMTAIMGYAELLLAQEPDSERIEFLQSIRRNGHFLLNIINDILDVSKMEAGQMEAVRECVAIEDVVADVHSMMHLRAIEKDLRFEVEFRGCIPEKIETDAKRLRQILLNLIGNAIKFTDAGTVRLIVAFEDDGDVARMHFDVHDTGIGMTDEQKDRLFKPFSQGSELVSRAFGGTGLGLAISQRLAEMLGGEIVCESEYGKGSQFTCTVSAGDVADVELIEPQIRGHNSDTESIADVTGYKFPATILVVDDQHDVRTLLRHLLEPTGATLEFAGDGLQAVKRVQEALATQEPIDLILLDMRMPGMDGYHTASRLRTIGYVGPVIALTADAMHGDVARCLAMGCDAYLSKPVEALKLFETIADALQQIGPQIPDTQRTAALKPATSVSAEGTGSAGKGQKVLIVDDSEDACVAIQLLLQLQGYEVEIAHDGNTAIETARGFLPDVVLLDISLPDMDGFAVLEKLRADDAVQDARFFAITGHTDIGSDTSLRQAGFEQHLLKPLEIARLLNLLAAGESQKIT